MSVLLKIQALWAITPCCWVCGCRRLEGTLYRLPALLDSEDDDTVSIPDIWNYSQSDTTTHQEDLDRRLHYYCCY